MKGEKEPSSGLQKTFATCMESPGILVAKENWRGGAYPIAIKLYLVGLIRHIVKYVEICLRLTI